MLNNFNALGSCIKSGVKLRAHTIILYTLQLFVDYIKKIFNMQIKTSDFIT
jgi:hypothetical protein